MNDITIRRPIQWQGAAATHVGTVRSMNEDAVLARPEIGLWLVADGMGGHDAGDVASSMIVESFSDLPKPQALSSFVDTIEQRVMAANQRLLEYSEIMLDGRVVGSTFICLLIYKEVGVSLWMGDSRLYLHRGQQLTQLSRDHSEVAELLRAGAITEEQAADHPEANVITRAVGTSEELYIDLEVFEVRAGDTFLLCSDGLYNCLDKASILRHLNGGNPQEMAAALIDDALEHGASDNVSAIVVKGVRRPL